MASVGGRGQQAGQVTELGGGGQEPKGRVVVEKVVQSHDMASEVEDCRLFY